MPSPCKPWPVSRKSFTWLPFSLVKTQSDIADAMRKLEAHEREHVTEKSHVFGHSDNPNTKVAKPESIN